MLRKQKGGLTSSAGATQCRCSERSRKQAIDFLRINRCAPRLFSYIYQTNTDRRTFVDNDKEYV